MGHEINAIAENQMQLHQQYAHDLPAQKMFEAYRKVINTWETVLKIPGSAYKYLRKSKARVVDAIQQAAPAIGKEKALELFQISKSTFQIWLLEVNRHCIASYFQACSKVYPNQLTNKQGMEIKPYLNCHCFATDALKSMRAI